MISFCYSIFDLKAQSYRYPFPAVNDAVAFRMVSDLMRTENVYSLHPEDFSLIKVGSFDDDTGVLEAVKEQVILANLSQFVSVQPSENKKEIKKS